MRWDRSSSIGLSLAACTYCGGNGTRIIRMGSKNEREVTCNCAYRHAFRACLARFRECAAGAGRATTVSWEPCGRNGRRTYSRKREEFMADFCLVSRRVLNGLDHEVFRCHFLLGGDWRLCCRQLGIDRGTVFHTIYRIEQQLGRAFAELKPYSLWPLDEYFGGSDSPMPLMQETPDSRHTRPIFPDRLFGPLTHDQAKEEKAISAGSGPVF